MMYALSSRRLALIVVSLGCLSIVSGCSGRPKNVTKRVTGTVTLGGQPLPNAFVTFVPMAEKGSPSFGTTDESGKYVLYWSQTRGRKIEGAQIGESVVKITTMIEEDPTADPPIAAVPEKVPFKYREEGGYPKVTVNRGSNTIDIALDAGPAEKPQAKTKTRPGARKVEPGCF